jgi:hypothetical protein
MGGIKPAHFFTREFSPKIMGSLHCHRQRQGELLGKPALVAVIHYTALSCLRCPRADADGGLRKQQNPHTGCSDAVSFAAHPGLVRDRSKERAYPKGNKVIRDLPG